VERILVLRRTYGRCAEVVHAMLLREGVTVSLSTVKRVLLRHGMIRQRSPYKRWHQSGERPKVEKPGDLVEIDSIHVWQRGHYVSFIIAALDCFSRWAYARVLPGLACPASARILFAAQKASGVQFQTVQSDHGPEFTSFFTMRLNKAGIQHRHIRVRKPNDNAHIERFNRTLQEDLAGDLQRFGHNVQRLNHTVIRYLDYYNEQRPHLGLGCSTPAEVLRSS
jgi:transposase InsO family protein